jgi:S-methylmethionine-dependent homocysteine/selenocysteine methylase
MTTSPLNRLLAGGKILLADGGLETCMIYHEGFDLPQFASFVLVDSERGRAALDRYFARFLTIAKRAGAGFLLDTATWRANMGWAAALGMGEQEIRAVNGRAAAFAFDLRDAHAAPGFPIVVNGVIGPSGDGYRIEAALTPDQAQGLHRPQIEALAEAGVDMVTAVTMTHVGEAVGIARAAGASGLPHAVSFTVEVDGRLPSGQTLHEALAQTEALTGGSALFYMVNCAHPTHFARELSGPMRDRIGGIRANASRLSHAELDVATELDDGDPIEFGHFYGAFARYLPNLRIVGGCCGSDHRHVGEACSHLTRRAA